MISIEGMDLNVDDWHGFSSCSFDCSFRSMAVMRATSGPFSRRVEFPHCTLGGLPDVDHSLPDFCRVACAMSPRASWHPSGAVLAPLGAVLDPQEGTGYRTSFPLKWLRVLGTAETPQID